MGKAVWGKQLYPSNDQPSGGERLNDAPSLGSQGFFRNSAEIYFTVARVRPQDPVHLPSPSLPFSSRELCVVAGGSTHRGRIQAQLIELTLCLDTLHPLNISQLLQPCNIPRNSPLCSHTNSHRDHASQDPPQPSAVRRRRAVASVSRVHTPKTFNSKLG
ncbi:hypothetical protein G7K_4150-t1 [Saitoella complicata NRRL Y-17804]|uniref:Uncharacterized protein n=1 Tax=Saitoella complicata (strain BCRC 22490 / CBS 7301 / JCM 7358 / NBRC 10748 / NRRL Y-17804) TaxID=698492 RepID=A0A0E9NKS8_SAICN|nr:hypothetical protein G7K_4150-t1 [Saitoella complicata NRRL Y-17804]